MIIQNSSSSTVESFNANSGGFGVLLNGSSGITVLSSITNSNTGFGIKVNGVARTL
jgi:hypothetical protein